jgi:hypothetical protein
VDPSVRLAELVFEAKLNLSKKVSEGADIEFKKSKVQGYFTREHPRWTSGCNDETRCVLDRDQEGP